MVKPLMTDRQLAETGVERLVGLVHEAPMLEVTARHFEVLHDSRVADAVVRVRVGRQQFDLVCEAKTASEPRHVRMAIYQVLDVSKVFGEGGVPLLIAPYLSPESRSICRQAGINYLDLEGNARLTFGTVFIERTVANKPKPEKRALKSLFKPASARVLRCLLRDPSKSWRVVDLAEAAGVSVGHVSNVRKALHDREWAEIGPDGLVMSDPTGLLDAWRKAYEPKGETIQAYTTLHGRAFDDAARHAISASAADGIVLMAGFTAARWLAPYARAGMESFYVDGPGRDRLVSALSLDEVESGGNVELIRPGDAGILDDRTEPAPGAVCTSPVQTYLDLCVAGPRGREAGEHLRRTLMPWARP